MRKTITKVFSCAVIFAFLLSCTDGSAGNVVEDWPWEDPAEPEQPAPDPGPEDPNPAILDLGWTNVGDAYGNCLNISMFTDHHLTLMERLLSLTLLLLI